jgi:hypothetical protein
MTSIISQSLEPLPKMEHLLHADRHLHPALPTHPGQFRVLSKEIKNMRKFLGVNEGLFHSRQKGHRKF